jgi:hypothetical protein
MCSINLTMLDATANFVITCKEQNGTFRHSMPVAGVAIKRDLVLELLE